MVLGKFDHYRSILSVDVEDISCANFPLKKKYIPDKRNIEKGIKNALKLLELTNSTATFFILGSIAKENSNVIKDIVNSGNRVASHGMTHRLIYQIGREEFREEVRKSKNMLEDITGTSVKGYRAPSWSITKKSLWALDILKEEGFAYDSSIFPVKNFLYGIDNTNPYPHNIGNLWEIPPSTLPFLYKRIPIGGGFYLRFSPSFFVLQGMNFLKKRKIPFVLYSHTWEISPPSSLPEYSLFHHFLLSYNLYQVKKKVLFLLDKEKFISIEEYLNV